MFTGHSGPQQTGTGTVIITVVDTNDNAPIYDHEGTQIGHILENAPENTEILTVHATDRDEGKNSEIR